MVRRRAVIVAPYCPGGAHAHLGAAKKIELVAGMLLRLGFELHFVDSSHDTPAFAPSLPGSPDHVGGAPVTLWRPFRLPSRKLGKLLNVFFSERLFARIAEVRPALVWLYNAYAFEARLGLALRQRIGCRLVLELEDLPLARKRGWNPKPLLDQRYFETLLRHADLITFVNAALQTRHASRAGGDTLLLPSILEHALTAGTPHRHFTASTLRLGYFGGLEPDKGVDILLAILPLLPGRWTLVVTGAGSLAASFGEAQAAFPSKLEFHGRVPHERVVQLMQGCDAIVNPHASIAHMDDGVFPFKVCEAIASGALLISTPLPAVGLDLSRSVSFFDGTLAGLFDALMAAPQRYDERLAEIRATREAVCERYGEDAVRGRLKAALDGLLGPVDQTWKPA